MKKIALLSLSASTYGGGSYLPGIVPALSRNFPSVEFLIVVREGANPNLSGFPNVTTLELSFWGINNRYIRLIWSQFFLVRRLERENVDCVYTTISMGLLGKGLPVVNAVRNMEPFVATANATLKDWARRKLLNFLTVTFCKRSTRVVAVSGFVKNTIARAGIPESKIDVVYHGIEKHNDVADNVFDAKKPYVATSGKFISYANFEASIGALYTMRNSGYKGRLLVAGGPFDKNYESKVRRLVTSLGLEDHVEFIGYRARRDILELAREADVLFFPSRVEACPFTFLEGMSEGAAIVSSCNPPMPEFGGDGAKYVDPEEPEEFGVAALEILRSRDVRADLKQKASARSLEFSWDSSANNLMSCLQQAFRDHNL